MKANKPEDVSRFIERGPRRECWPWAGGTFSGRYGRFSLNGRSLLAHRVVYQLEKGEIPDGLMVMHKCNNKLCCNPNHLTVGTGTRNMLHASTSGAFALGASGRRGIWWDKKREYWIAGAYIGGKKFNLYTGPHLEKAIAAREKWEEVNGVSFNLEKDT
jgi:hypothetical protein